VSAVRMGLVMNMKIRPKTATTMERSAMLMLWVPALFMSRVSCKSSQGYVVGLRNGGSPLDGEDAGTTLATCTGRHIVVCRWRASQVSSIKHGGTGSPAQLTKEMKQSIAGLSDEVTHLRQPVHELAGPDSIEEPCEMQR